MLVLDQAAERVDPVGVFGGAADVLEIAHHAGIAHQREAMPAREGGVPLGRDGERVAPWRILRALAEQGATTLSMMRASKASPAIPMPARPSGTSVFWPGVNFRMEKSLVPPPKSPMSTVEGASSVRVKR